MVVLVDWLRSHGLGRYASVLEENEVDFDTLRILSEEDLAELGLPFGPRKKLLRALEGMEAPFAEPAVSDGAARPLATLDGVPAGERRQLTVLFCDLVGFTEMAGRLDPEDLQTVVRRYEDACAGCVARYEGYVFQRVGDGIVAFFGYPMAHEAEAERAVRAGLEMLEAMETLQVAEVDRLHVRIGIATGLVVVSSAERSAVGETMNLASRLQTLAEPDTLVVSERVRRLAGGGFEYEDLGSHDLKGIRRPTHAYRVSGLRTSVSRFDAATHEGLTPFVGREAEMRLLEERWERAGGGRGQAVEVCGEPGIGKSRIVSAFRTNLEKGGARSLRFQCSPYHVHSPFHPVITHLEAALDFEPGEPPAARLDRLDRFLRELGRPESDAPFLAALLTLPWQERYGPLELPPREVKEETLRALVGLIEAATTSAPTVVLFEDLHWADPTTLEVLDQVVAHLEGIPSLFLLTYRPEFSPRWLDYEYVSALTVGRLGPDESLALVDRVTAGKALPRDLLDTILERTDGIPLYIEELTKTILESGSLRLEGDAYVYAGEGRRVEIPPTLRDSLMARLDRVPEVKEVAQVGAAIGREFSYELLAALADLEDRVLDERLTRLAESGLVFQWGAPPGAMYSFKHALVQDAAYESMLKSRRQRLHGRIAGVLEERFPETRATAPELLAHHYAAAGEHEVASPYWRQAGELALERFALREATAHLHGGLQSISSRPEGAERDRDALQLRTLLSPAMVAVHGWAAPEVHGTLEPALELARSLDHRESYLQILTGLWIHFMSAGAHAEAMGWAEETLSVAAETGDEDLRICGHRSAMTSNFWMGDLHASREHGDWLKQIYDPERHAHIASLTNNDPLTADGSYRAQYLWMLGYPDQAAALSDAKDQHARQRGHPFDLCFALTVGAQTFDYRREPETLLERVEEAIRVGRENRIPLMSEIMAPLVKGAAWLRQGKPAEAADLLGPTLADLVKTGHRAWVPYVRANLAEAVARVGDLDDGLALLGEALEQMKRQGEFVHYAEALRLKGWMLLRRGAFEAAEEALERAVSFASDQGTRSWELRAATTLARMWAEQGKMEAAHDLLQPIVDWFTEGLDTADLVEARELLADLS